MNNTKKILVILSIILALGDLAWKIYYVVNYFMLAPQNRPILFYAVFEIIDIVAIIAEITLLSIAMLGNGKYFQQRYGLYVTAFMLSVVFNLLSISTILLIASMFTSNMVWIKEEREEVAPGVEVIEETKEEKIQRLRKQRDEGKITQEEFEKEIAELL